MRERIRKMKADPDWHKFVYLIPKSKSVNLFQLCLTEVVSSNNKIEFVEGFSQKIEHRNTNSELSAVFGCIDLENTEVEFLFADVETSQSQSFFSTQKVRMF